jgi:hypothetical protein
MALALSSAHPCAAAEDLRELGRQETRTTAFAGGTVRLKLGADQRAARPEARLHAGFARISRDSRAGVGPQMLVGGLALGQSKKGGLAFLVGGSDVTQLKHRMGMSTAGAIAIGVGATLIALIAIAAAAAPPDFGCGLSSDPDEC